MGSKLAECRLRLGQANLKPELWGPARFQRVLLARAGKLVIICALSRPCSLLRLCFCHQKTANCNKTLAVGAISAGRNGKTLRPHVLRQHGFEPTVERENFVAGSPRTGSLARS